MMKNLIFALFAALFFAFITPVCAQNNLIFASSTPSAGMRPILGLEGDTVWVSSRGPISYCAGDCTIIPTYKFNQSGGSSDTLWVHVSILHREITGMPTPSYFETYIDTFTVSQVFKHLTNLMESDKKKYLADLAWGNQTALPGDETIQATKLGDVVKLTLNAEGKSYTVSIKKTGVTFSNMPKNNSNIGYREVLYLFLNSNF